MTVTVAVLLGCAACFALKLLGYAVPDSLLAGARTQRVTTLLPVALLAALVAVQAVADGPALVVDARVPALVVVAVLLWRRANFVVVVVAGAAVAALVRALGLLP